MKKIAKFLILASVFLILVLPALSFALEPTGPLVPCDNTVSVDSNGNALTNSDGTPKIDHPCGFNALMALVNNVINFILFYMAIPIAAIMMAYAGLVLVTAGGEAAGARTKAKGIFFNAVLGLVIATGA